MKEPEAFNEIVKRYNKMKEPEMSNYNNHYNNHYSNYIINDNIRYKESYEPRYYSEFNNSNKPYTAVAKESETKSLRINNTELRNKIAKLKEELSQVKINRNKIAEQLIEKKKEFTDQQKVNRQLRKKNKELKEEQEAINEHFRRFDLLDL